MSYIEHSWKFIWILSYVLNLNNSKLIVFGHLFYNKKNYIQEMPQKKAVLVPIKSSWDDDPGFRHGFGAEASLPLTQGAPVVSHNTTRLYWMVFDLYECLIRSDAVTVLFWIFFIYSLFSAGESLSLVKNVEVEFEIKPRHPISRGNMSVDQPFLIHCSCRSSYFSNFRWCAQSMLVSEGIVNSAMITFFWINWPNDEIWMLTSWCYFKK